MSFMGAVGFIMDGSGLQELFQETYAGASVIKMMTGHAYSRALRAHILAHIALTKLVLSMTKITEKEESAILQFLVNFTGQSKFQDTDLPDTAGILRKFNTKLNELGNNS